MMRLRPHPQIMFAEAGARELHLPLTNSSRQHPPNTHANANTRAPHPYPPSLLKQKRMTCTSRCRCADRSRPITMPLPGRRAGVGQEWGRSGAAVGQEWGSSGAAVGQEWRRSGAAVGQEWRRSGAGRSVCDVQRVVGRAGRIMQMSDALPCAQSHDATHTVTLAWRLYKY